MVISSFHRRLEPVPVAIDESHVTSAHRFSVFGASNSVPRNPSPSSSLSLHEGNFGWPKPSLTFLVALNFHVASHVASRVVVSKQSRYRFLPIPPILPSPFPWRYSGISASFDHSPRLVIGQCRVRRWSHAIFGVPAPRSRCTYTCPRSALRREGQGSSDLLLRSGCAVTRPSTVSFVRY